MEARSAVATVAMSLIIGLAMVPACLAETAAPPGVKAAGETQEAEEGSQARTRRRERPRPRRAEDIPRPGIPMGEEQLNELKRRAEEQRGGGR
jgi:hypothetical protein